MIFDEIKIIEENLHFLEHGEYKYEPNNKYSKHSTNADCVSMKGGVSEFTWWDMDCDSDYKFLCQTPMQSSPATTQAPTCSNGQYGNGLTCTPCPENTFSTTWDSSIDVVDSCTACGANSHTNGLTGRIACTHCDDGYYGNGATCTPCPANKFSASWNGSVDNEADCTHCNVNSHTNGASGLTACTHCDDGYYGNGVLCDPCPANKFSASWTLSVASDGDCTPCYSNSHTNGATGLTACTHCDNGFYGNGVTCNPCPANRFSALWSGSIASESDCTPCNANSHTNGMAGLTACTHCDNGYYGSGVTCTACPIDTYSTTWSTSITTAGHCMSCSPGYSTNGQIAQTSPSSCTGISGTCANCLNYNNPARKSMLDNVIQHIYTVGLAFEIRV